MVVPWAVFLNIVKLKSSMLLSDRVNLEGYKIHPVLEGALETRHMASLRSKSNLTQYDKHLRNTFTHTTATLTLYCVSSTSGHSHEAPAKQLPILTVRSLFPRSIPIVVVIIFSLGVVPQGP